jgi:hypothetical protein
VPRTDALARGASPFPALSLPKTHALVKLGTCDLRHWPPVVPTPTRNEVQDTSKRKGDDLSAVPSSDDSLM